jgi:hypothetical protein
MGWRDLVRREQQPMEQPEQPVVDQPMQDVEMRKHGAPTRLYEGYNDRGIAVAGKVAVDMYGSLLEMDRDYNVMAAQAPPMVEHGKTFDAETSSLLEQTDKAVQLVKRRAENIILQNGRNHEWVRTHRAERLVFMERLASYMGAHRGLGERTAVDLARVLNNGASLVQNHDSLRANDDHEAATRATYHGLEEEKLGVRMMLDNLRPQHERANNALLDAEDAAAEKAERVRLMGARPTESEIEDGYQDLKAQKPEDTTEAAMNALLGAAELTYSYGSTPDSVITIDAGVMNAKDSVGKLTARIKRFKGRDEKLDQDIAKTLAELEGLQDLRNQIEAFSGRLLEDVVTDGRQAARRMLVKRKLHDPQLQNFYEEGRLLQQYGEEGTEYIQEFLQSMDRMNAVEIPVAPRHSRLDLGRDEEKVIVLRRVVELAGEKIADDLLGESLAIIAQAMGNQQITERQYLQRQIEQ